MMLVGLLKPWLLRYTFWWRVEDCLFDFEVTSKETLLSFDTLAKDPERAVETRSRQGLPLVVNVVSCWVLSKMGEVGSCGASYIVKVMTVDPLSPV